MFRSQKKLKKTHKTKSAQLSKKTAVWPRCQVLKNFVEAEPEDALGDAAHLRDVRTVKAPTKSACYERTVKNDVKLKNLACWGGESNLKNQQNTDLAGCCAACENGGNWSTPVPTESDVSTIA